MQTPNETKQNMYWAFLRNFEGRDFGYSFCRGLIIVNDYHEKKILNAIQTLIDEGNCKDFEEFRAYIGKYFELI